MKRSRFFALFLSLSLLIFSSFAQSKILVIAPHPDDDVLIASGVIYAATQRGEQVNVVYMTNGDAAGVSTGLLRQGEAVNAQNILGVNENSLIFLGYPDGGLISLYFNFPRATDSFLGANGQTATYGNRGLGLTDYHNFRFGTHAAYNGFNAINDLKEIITSIRPDQIITLAEFDVHGDHGVTNLMTIEAIKAVSAAIPGYIPILNQSLVWTTNPDTWPNAENPQTNFIEPAGLAGSGLQWTARESLDVPAIMQVTDISNLKKRALNSHVSQGGASDSFLGRFVHKDEFFWPVTFNTTNLPPRVDAGTDQTVAQGALVALNGGLSSDPDGNSLTYRWRQISGPAVTLVNPGTANPSFIVPTGLQLDTRLEFELVVSDGVLATLADHVSVFVNGSIVVSNIAPLATVTASSENSGTGQLAIKAVDGVIDGFPGDFTREWATVNQGVGAWLQLNWSTSYQITRVKFYDRPNLNDQILSATLSFSDGSSFTIGALDNSGVGVEFNGLVLADSMRITVTTVSGSTQSVGLAEVEVFGAAVSTTTPLVSLSPTALSFSDQLLNTTSVNQTVNVSNSGGANLLISGVALNVGTSFSIVNGCPSSLAPGSSCAINVKFTPAQLGPLSDVLTITDNANGIAGSKQTVTLTGNGVAPVATVSQTSLVFGDQTVGSSSSAKIVTLSNSGTGTLNISAISATAPFQQTNNCGVSLAPGANCLINVSFTPSTGGAALGSLVVTDNSNGIPGSKQTTVLSGNGVVQNTLPVANVSPTVVSFSDQLFNTTSNSQIINVSNSGGANLLISGVALNVGTHFSIVNGCPSSLAPGSSCAISVKFTPAQLGSVVDILSITDNTNGIAGSKQTVTLLGTGIAPVAVISPASVNFDNQTVGSTSSAKIVTLSNGGTGTLTISAINAPAPFQQTNNCGVTLAPGASCAISVSFAPSTGGAASGNLVVTDNSNGIPGSKQSSALSGTGIVPVTAPTIPSIVRDNFNRFNIFNLGSNWQQSSDLLGKAVLYATGSQAKADLNGTSGYAYFTTSYLSTQAVGFTFSSTIVNNTALFLKSTGSMGLFSGQLRNAIRVLYSNGNVNIAYTNNGDSLFGPSYTNVGTAISTGGSLVNGNSLRAAVDQNGKVWVWKLVGSTTTLLTPSGVQMPNVSLWTSGGGRVGMQLPNLGIIDNFVAY